MGAMEHTTGARTSGSDSEKGAVNHYENTTTPGKTTFGQKLKAHTRRFWWVHVILFLIGTLVITLILVYVAFPKISQNGVDDSSLSIVSISVLDPTPTSFHLVQDSFSDSTSVFHPKLDAFNASLSLLGKDAYGIITLPEIQSGDHVEAKIDQVVEITNLDAFIEYNIAMVGSEKVTVHVKGQTGLHEGAFPVSTVDFDKSVEMNGFDSLKGFAVTKFEIKPLAEADGTNMIGTVYIPNPSVLTVAMGNVTFNNYVDGKYIGNSTFTNFVMKPGNNTIEMRSIVDQISVINLVTSKYKDGKLPIDIIGNSSVYNGEHLVYYEKALQALKQHIVLDLAPALSALGLNVSSTA